MIAFHRVPLSSCVVAAASLCGALLCPLPPAQAQVVGSERIAGSDATVTDTRSVSGIRGIVLGVPANVEITQGSHEGVTITGADNVVPLVETVVEDGMLKIRWARKVQRAPTVKSLAVVVSVKSVESLAIGGAGRMHAATLASPRLKVTIGGSGDVALDALAVETFAVTIGGSGTLTAAGRADVLEATLAGSGELSTPKLDTRQARVTMQGSGRAEVWVNETLSATIAGSGEVVYRGTPQVRQTIVGSGTVARARDAS